MNRLILFLWVVGIAWNGELRVDSNAIPKLSLSLAKEIRVGQTKQSDVLKRLGKPDRVLELEDSGSRRMIWAYFSDNDPSVGRLSVSFPNKSDTTDAVTFTVRKGDREQDLDYALDQFKAARFRKELPKQWENPHSSPDEVFYEDSKSGLTIVYLQGPKRVTAITWTLPDRKTTSDLESSTKPPFPYCLVGLCASQP